ncbi:MAG: hypothetical protein ABSG19_07385 [Candidatus Aminicenantales bacterium]
MIKCRYEDLIDGYLLDKLKPEEQTDFEEHYFICRSCFSKMSDRDEIIQVLKKEGMFNAPGEYRFEDSKGESWLDRVAVHLTPRRWVAIGVSAAAIVLAVWLLIPRPGSVSSPFILSGDATVRGGALTILSPVADVGDTPAFLEWKAAGDELEYKVSLSGKSSLMSASTKETRIALPNDVKARIKPGVRYSWQVQAFKADGTLVAVSGRVKFRVVPKS